MNNGSDYTYAVGHRRHRSSQLERRVSDWFETGVGALEQRLNSLDDQRLPSDADPRYIPMPPSTWSSGAPSVQSGPSYPGSAQVPSLTSFGSSGRSDASSLQTGLAPDTYQNMSASSSSSGVEAALVPQSAAWQCPFGFLGCSQTFEDVATWDMHCRAHLRNQLPKHVECPFSRCDWKYTGLSGHDAWSYRWDHVLAFHSRGGFVKTRASRAMVDHLYTSRLIDNAKEQELRGTSTGPYTVSSSTSRRRDRHRGGLQIARSGWSC